RAMVRLRGVSPPPAATSQSAFPIGRTWPVYAAEPRGCPSYDPLLGNFPICEFKDAWNQGQRGTESIGYGSNDKHEGSEALWSTACLADFRLFARNPDGRL